MLLKFAIVFLLLALIASLGAGFYFLMVDQGNPEKRRLVNSLGLRIALACTLMVLIVYGVGSGQLKSNAPWERHAGAAATGSENTDDESTTSEQP